MRFLVCPNNQQLVSQHICGHWSCTLANNLLLTCDNAACQKRAKTEGWLLRAVSIAIFLVVNYLIRSCFPWPAILCHPQLPWITKPMPHAMPFRSINLTTQKRSRSIDRSSGEFCNFLSGQLSSWNSPPLTCHLMQPSSSLDCKPHNPCHTLS